jgi:hypothetical protein
VDLEVGERERKDEQPDDDDGDAELDHPARGVGLAGDDEPDQQEKSHGQREHQPVRPGGQRLQDKEEAEQREVAGAALLAVQVQEQERERYPLHGQQVQVGEVGDLVRGVGEGDARDHPGEATAGEVSYQEVAAQGGHEEMEYQHEVGGLHRVVGHGDDGGGEHGGDHLVVGVGQGVAVRVEDVGVEEVQRVLRKCVQVPGDGPHLVGRVIGVADDGRVAFRQHGPGEERGEQREEQQDDEEYGCASPGRHAAPPAI